MAALLTSLALAIAALMYFVTKEIQKEAQKEFDELKRKEDQKHWLEQCKKYGAK